MTTISIVAHKKRERSRKKQENRNLYQKVSHKEMCVCKGNGKKKKKIYSSDCKAICSTIFNFPRHKIDSVAREKVASEGRRLKGSEKISIIIKNTKKFAC